MSNNSSLFRKSFALLNSFERISVLATASNRAASFPTLCKEGMNFLFHFRKIIRSNVPPYLPTFTEQQSTTYYSIRGSMTLNDLAERLAWPGLGHGLKIDLSFAIWLHNLFTDCFTQSGLAVNTALEAETKELADVIEKETNKLNALLYKFSGSEKDVSLERLVATAVLSDKLCRSDCLHLLCKRDQIDV